MTNKITKISATVFGIWSVFVAMAMVSYLDIVDDALSDPVFSNALGDAIKGIFMFMEAVGWLNFMVWAISGLFWWVIFPKRTKPN